MKRTYHVTLNNAVIDSTNTYEDAKEVAIREPLGDNDKIEITHMGLLVWGGKFKP